MRAVDLVVRCYAERKDGVWIACCIDFCLAAQASTPDEALQKLLMQIQEYVYDAVAGEDKEFGAQLLKRRAPLPMFVKYYWFKTRQRLHILRQSVARLCESPVRLPLDPSIAS